MHAMSGFYAREHEHAASAAQKYVAAQLVFGKFEGKERQDYC
jgi:hypothetical protein